MPANSWDQDTPLHGAAQEGYTSMVELLLAKGANVNAANNDQNTPLHIAVLSGHTSTVEKLLHTGANVNAVNKYTYKTPLHYAAGKDDNKSIEALLSKGAKVEVVDKDNKTPLHYAVEKGDNKSVKALLSAGAKVEVVDKRGENALNMVLYYPNTVYGFNDDMKLSAINVMKLLLDTNIPLDNVDRHGKTPLQYIDSNIRSAGTKTDFYKEAKLLLLKAIQRKGN
ncbi:uncharacterized protein LOC102807626 [Saccoglossus kowalevskii]